MIYIFDFEVMQYNWVLVAKPVGGEHLVFCNDNEAVREFIERERPLLCGFNCKNYDSYIMRAVLGGYAPSLVKMVNDHIIGGGDTRVLDIRPEEGYSYIPFNCFDLMDDMQKGLSLKSIEAHLGMDIRECSVPFNIDRPLTDEELDEVIAYCKADVDATEQLYHLRKTYLENKIYIGSLKDIPPERALYMTNAKLTAAYLDAHAKEHNDEREYVYPANLKREYIPQEVFDFFDRLHDKSIPDEEIFGSKLEIFIGETPITIGYGGIHAAIPHYQFREGVV